MTVETLFWIATVIGGTVLAFQTVMMLLGWGDHDDLAGMQDADATGGFHDGDFSAGSDHTLHHDHGLGDHAANWFYEIISVRTVSAGAAVFGISGHTALAWGYSKPGAFLVAMVAGGAAIYGVYWMYRQVYRLQHSGTENIRNAVGLPAVVYVPIPPSGNGAGKVTFKLQNRTVEYLAVTEEPRRIPTGEKVIITAVVSSDTVQVASAVVPTEELAATTTHA